MAEKKILTIGIVRKDFSVLLGLKLRGFGAGLWNGPGGKAKEGEDAFSSFKREIEEESGLIIDSAEKVALIEFKFADEPEKILETHVFEVRNWIGEPQDGEEMAWQWFKNDEIPHDKMWPADRNWLPSLLEGKRIHGIVLYDNQESKNVISQEFREVQDFD